MLRLQLLQLRLERVVLGVGQRAAAVVVVGRVVAGDDAAEASEATAKARLRVVLIPSPALLPPPLLAVACVAKAGSAAISLSAMRLLRSTASRKSR